jgi:HAD superfamily hydrolase (TIGR01459 family)
MRLYNITVFFKSKTSNKIQEKAMSRLEYKHLKNAIDNYEVILFDLWGVIVEGNIFYEGVIDEVNRIMERKKVVFLSNAPRPNFVVAKNLNNWGLKNVSPDNVLTSGDIARKIIKEKTQNLGKKPVIYHLGADRNDDILVDMEYEITEDVNNTDILLLSIFRDEHEDINEFNDLLKKAANRSDILTICSNPDTTIPKNGILRYCAGYFAKIIEEFGGGVVYTGKPEAIIYKEILKKHARVKNSQILMVGDTFETDILGANKAGIHSALVMTGNAYKFHKIHEKIEDKLEALSKHSDELNIKPTFVTEIA